MTAPAPRLVAASVALLIGLAALTGCTDSAPDAAPAAGSTSTPTPSVDPDDTLWRVTSTDERLPLEDPDVQELQKVVALHSGVSDNRSPATVRASVAAEEESFAPLFLERLSGQGYEEAVVAMYVDNDLTIEQTGVAWTPSTVDADRMHATVGFESIFRIVSASDGFLHELDAEAGVEVVQPREYRLTKIDGAWLIDDIEKGPLRKAQGTP
ncbi:hypothetical protein [Streptomyces sp. AC495_CC817]|uniref:hypothetical protein n=1 Tax=Streptomyces sp. AC495_CC817 TaxID=2823900 RepID=UPI001C2799E7|nr:hypothetical protein [Streptomyces sp. AC495_CC817]